MVISNWSSASSSWLQVCMHVVSTLEILICLSVGQAKVVQEIRRENKRGRSGIWCLVLCDTLLQHQLQRHWHLAWIGSLRVCQPNRKAHLHWLTQVKVLVLAFASVNSFAIGTERIGTISHVGRDWSVGCRNSKSKTRFLEHPIL